VGSLLFTKDERAVVEPNSDLVAMVLAVIGFVIFISVMAHTYQIIRQDLQDRQDITQRQYPVNPVKVYHAF